jgi:hypothetical protein
MHGTSQQLPAPQCKAAAAAPQLSIFHNPIPAAITILPLLQGLQQLMLCCG